jgi:hypothetical protein
MARKRRQAAALQTLRALLSMKAVTSHRTPNLCFFILSFLSMIWLPKTRKEIMNTNITGYSVACSKPTYCTESITVSERFKGFPDEKRNALEKVLREKIIKRLNDVTFQQKGFKNTLNKLNKKEDEFIEINIRSISKFLHASLFNLYSRFPRKANFSLRSFVDTSISELEKKFDGTELINSIENIKNCYKGDIDYCIELHVDYVATHEHNELVFGVIERNGSLEISETFIYESKIVPVENSKEYCKGDCFHGYINSSHESNIIDVLNSNVKIDVPDKPGSIDWSEIRYDTTT